MRVQMATVRVSKREVRGPLLVTNNAGRVLRGQRSAYSDKWFEISDPHCGGLKQSEEIWGPGIRDPGRTGNWFVSLIRYPRCI